MRTTAQRLVSVSTLMTLVFGCTGLEDDATATEGSGLDALMGDSGVEPDGEGSDEGNDEGDGEGDEDKTSGDAPSSRDDTRGDGPVSDACDDSERCDLPDDTVGVCIDGVCEALPDCSADDDCALLDGPCARGSCVDGTCEAVPEAAGTECDDGSWCSVDDVCDDDGTCGGDPRDCADALDCTADACDDSAEACVATVREGCMIDDACIPSDAIDPADMCGTCDPARSTTAYSPVVEAADGDGCCPDGASALTDSDCVPVCGNGVTEGYEACDDGGVGGGCTDLCTTDPVRPAVSASSSASCALTSRGELTCWGSTSNPFPDDTFIDVCGAYNICALRPNGEAACWGDAEVAAPAGETFTQLACADYVVCGLRADGTTRCWGQTPYYPELVMPPSDKLIDVAGGAAVFCGVRASNGSAVCWGWDGGGAVSGTTGTSQLVTVRPGYWSHCGLDGSGRSTCWGVGIVDGANGTSGIAQMSSGQGIVCAVLTSGRLACWNDADRALETLNEMPSGGGFVHVSVSLNGSTHACAINTADRVTCWGGMDASGQQDVPAHLRP